MYVYHVRLVTVHRKIELVEYARSTRLLFIRLLALVKWASSAGSLSKCDVSCMKPHHIVVTMFCVFTTPPRSNMLGGI